jgi:hypothetical protein
VLVHAVGSGVGLAAVQLAGGTFTRPLGIILRKGRKLYPNTEAFIEVLKHGKVRRAKLNYLRSRLGKAATNLKTRAEKIKE